MLGGTLGGAGGAAYVFYGGAAGVGLSGAGSAAGVMLLSTLVGLRWGVGKWERAKRKWWADWWRVGDGLGRDLEVRRVFPFLCFWEVSFADLVLR